MISLNMDFPLVSLTFSLPRKKVFNSGSGVFFFDIDDPVNLFLPLGYLFWFFCCSVGVRLIGASFCLETLLELNLFLTYLA